MQQVNWFERNFEFNIAQNIFPSIIERLEGTGPRLEHKMKNINLSILDVRLNDTWSIKENIGHLTDLEQLWQCRLTEIIRGEKTMSAADLDNTKTKHEHHNDQPLDELLQSFRNIRQQTIAGLRRIDEAVIFKSALHPRLNKPMRTMDRFIFVAEHDDHHLARISELIHILRAR